MIPVTKSNDKIKNIIFNIFFKKNLGSYLDFVSNKPINRKNKINNNKETKAKPKRKHFKITLLAKERIKIKSIKEVTLKQNIYNIK